MRPKNTSLSAGYIRDRSFFIAKVPDAGMNGASADLLAVSAGLWDRIPPVKRARRGGYR